MADASPADAPPEEEEDEILYTQDSEEAALPAGASPELAPASSQADLDFSDVIDASAVATDAGAEDDAPSRSASAALSAAQPSADYSTHPSAPAGAAAEPSGGGGGGSARARAHSAEEQPLQTGAAPLGQSADSPRTAVAAQPSDHSGDDEHDDDDDDGRGGATPAAAARSPREIAEGGDGAAGGERDAAGSTAEDGGGAGTPGNGGAADAAAGGGSGGGSGVTSVTATPRKKHGLGKGMLHTAKARWQMIHRAMLGMRGLNFMAKQAANDKNEFLKASEDALEHVAESHIKLEVKNAKELGKINYMQQGDASLYTPEALVQRHDVRHSPLVVAAIKAWWDWLPLSDASEDDQQIHVVAATHGAVKGKESQMSTGKVIIKPVYCAMVATIQLVLMPRFGLKADKDYDPSEDWEGDCKGHSAMHFPDFFDSLFELADMWCDSVSGEDYSALLKGLLEDAQRLQSRRQVFDAQLKKWGWKPPVFKRKDAAASIPSPPAPLARKASNAAALAAAPPSPLARKPSNAAAAASAPHSPPLPARAPPSPAPAAAPVAAPRSPGPRPVVPRSPVPPLALPPQPAAPYIPPPPHAEPPPRQYAPASPPPGPHIPRPRFISARPAQRPPLTRGPLSPEGQVRFAYRPPPPRPPPSPSYHDALPPPARTSKQLPDYSMRPLLNQELGMVSLRLDLAKGQRPPKPHDGHDGFEADDAAAAADAAADAAAACIEPGWGSRRGRASSARSARGGAGAGGSAAAGGARPGSSRPGSRKPSLWATSGEGLSTGFGGPPPEGQDHYRFWSTSDPALAGTGSGGKSRSPSPQAGPRRGGHLGRPGTAPARSGHPHTPTATPSGDPTDDEGSEGGAGGEGGGGEGGLEDGGADGAAAEGEAGEEEEREDAGEDGAEGGGTGGGLAPWLVTQRTDGTPPPPFQPPPPLEVPPLPRPSFVSPSSRGSGQQPPKSGPLWSPRTPPPPPPLADFRRGPAIPHNPPTPFQEALLVANSGMTALRRAVRHQRKESEQAAAAVAVRSNRADGPLSSMGVAASSTVHAMPLMPVHSSQLGMGDRRLYSASTSRRKGGIKGLSPHHTLPLPSRAGVGAAAAQQRPASAAAALRLHNPEAAAAVAAIAAAMAAGGTPGAAAPPEPRRSLNGGGTGRAYPAGGNGIVDRPASSHQFAFTHNSSWAQQTPAWCVPLGFGSMRRPYSAGATGSPVVVGRRPT